MAPPDPVLGPRWFTGARLNFAENLLRRYDDAEALVLWTERGPGRRLTYAQLGDAVARFAGVPARRRRRGGRPRRRLRPQHARGGRRDARRRVARRAVVVVLAGLRRRRRARPLRPDRAEGARHGRRLRLGRQAHRLAGARPRLPRRACRASSRSSSCRTCRPTSPATRALPDGAIAWADALARGDGSLLSFDATALRSPAVHHVLVGHDRSAEVHGARRRGHAAAAPEGARTAHRPARGTTGSCTSRPADG